MESIKIEEPIAPPQLVRHVKSSTLMARRRGVDPQGFSPSNRFQVGVQGRLD